MKTVIILGSSRKEGDTSKIVNKLIDKSNWDLIDLNDYKISYYDYEHQNKNDDYLPLMRQLIEKYDKFIFATPVYWYSMSGIMKVFFDRITDLLEIEKDLGRKLRGKNMAVISCSLGGHLGENFWLPFSQTASYLGMKYLGNIHVIEKEADISKLEMFIKQIEK
ncbi:NAD(P)H-dependent oxidoreductase [uncultured Algibacter sp.]|uniref:flavodoxin family protein n=1 Tax=uncultured Algibacter sp. TaxID=298659 RepID=UPI003217ED1B